MAKYLLTNTNQHGLLAIGSSEENLKVYYPNLDIHYKVQGTLYEISDEDFEGINLGTKTYTTVVDGAPVIEDVVPAGTENVTPDASEIDVLKQQRLFNINNCLKGQDFSSNPSWKTTIETYKTALENFDVNSVSYPVNHGIEKAMSDAGISPIIGDHQIV